MLKLWNKAAALALALVGLTAPVLAQTWDPTKPPTSGALVSADIRNNWNAIALTGSVVNVVKDPTYDIWPVSDSAAPATYTLAGASATIARAGTGLGDTNRKVGDFCAKVTSGGAAVATLNQMLLPTAAFTRADFLKSTSVSVGVWVRSATASAVRVGIADGISTTYTSFHTGGSTWQFLSVTHSVSASATKLELVQEVGAGTITGYFSGSTVVLGPMRPQNTILPREDYREVVWEIDGTLATGNDLRRWYPARPGCVKDVQLQVTTAPATNPVIVDVHTWDGAALTSMFSSKPQINAGAVRGGGQPTSTYARRCFTGIFGDPGTPAAGQVVAMDIDGIGSGTPGSNLRVTLRVLMATSPLEAFLAFGDIK